MKVILFTISLVLLVLPSSLKAGEDKSGNKASKILVNDNYNYISINQIKMWFSNNGDGSFDPLSQGSGFYWPSVTNKTAIYEDGLIFGGFYNGEIRVNGNTHRQGLQAGKILSDGTADDPSLAKYRVYKIRKNWEFLPPGPERDAYELDFNEWPIGDGAPYIDINGNGIPEPGIDHPQYVGDETAWYVSNDLDPSRSMWTYGTMPMGLEIQTTVFAFNHTFYQDMIFKKYVIINKGTTPIQDMYLSYWSDSDLGDGNDDHSGCDSILNLGFTWNGPNYDGVYGTPPPAVGYDLLQGPIVPGNPSDSARFGNGWRKGYKNLSMTSYAIYINTTNYIWRDPVMGVAAGSVEFYNYMQGLIWNGQPFINPHTGLATKYVVPGNPESGQGWYEGMGWPAGPPPGDRRHLMNSGPFTFNPGDTQEVVIGILIAVGNSNINSISAIKHKNVAMKELYNNYLFLTNVDDEVINFDYTLSQNYPNPFNPSTIISYSLPQRSFVRLKVYDIQGREIVTLVNKSMEQGKHSINFDPVQLNLNLTSGVYFYRIETENFAETRKMIYLK